MQEPRVVRKRDFRPVVERLERLAINDIRLGLPCCIVVRQCPQQCLIGGKHHVQHGWREEFLDRIPVIDQIALVFGYLMVEIDLRCLADAVHQSRIETRSAVVFRCLTQNAGENHGHQGAAGAPVLFRQFAKHGNTAEKPVFQIFHQAQLNLTGTRGEVGAGRKIEPQQERCREVADDLFHILMKRFAIEDGQIEGEILTPAPARQNLRKDRHDRGCRGQAGALGHILETRPVFRGKPAPAAREPRMLYLRWIACQRQIR